MDGNYIGVRPQAQLITDEAAITLSTTMKALWLPAKTLLPAGFWYARKTVRLTAFGKATTDGTAGNYVFELGYGSGDAPTPLVAGATVAGTVSQTNVSWKAEAIIECRSVGTSGVLRMWGQWSPAVALLASTLQPYIFPASAPADVTVDTTAGTNALTFQAQRSGAGVWTMTTTGILLEDIG